MKTCLKRSLSLYLVVLLAISAVFPAAAAGQDRASRALAKAVDYTCFAVPVPWPGNNSGGEWAVLALARSGGKVPKDYFQQYREVLSAYVSEKQGILHSRKYTEYSRTVLALAALGADPTNVGGYDLLKPLGSYDKVCLQGINGPIWALIALDSANYTVPQAPAGATQASRHSYVSTILKAQLPEGGWSLTGKEPADADLTAMALQALAGYQDQKAVKKAVSHGLALLSKIQTPQGGYESGGSETAESCAQVILALCALGVDLKDSRFVKNGNSVLDALLSYQLPDGSFRHVQTGTANQMATEQSMLALAAAVRMAEGRPGVFQMTDVTQMPAAGLAGKHPDVQVRPVVRPGKSFPDLKGHPSREAVEALAARAIVSGGDGGLYNPDQPMLRSQFCSAVVQALGLPKKKNAPFTDVSAGQWFTAPVGTAYAYDLVSGTGNGKFTPNATISRQEAVVMVAKAARICGVNTDMDAGQVEHLLAGYSDRGQVRDWAREDLAFCIENGLLSVSGSIRPTKVVTRGEMAQMLYALLYSAKLL